METNEQGHRAARRKEPKTGVEPKIKTVGVSEAAFVQVEAQAKNLKISKSRYASAAISYFAQNGLDPTANISGGLAKVNAVVEKETLLGRDHAAVIGNRLMSVIRTWERNLYLFLQEQQTSNLNYLEQIENTLHRQQTAVETNMLAPMVSLLLKAEAELTYLRELNVSTIMRAKNVDEARLTQVIDAEAEKVLKKQVEKLREFLVTNHVAQPRPTPKPGITPTPAVVSGVASMAADKRKGIPPEV